VNKASIIGIFIGISAILGGNFLEGGRISSIVQGSAALIVFGGTIGATFLSFSLKDIRLSAQMLKNVFYEEKRLPDDHAIIQDMVKYATKARQKGILALDSDMKNIGYDFFRRAIRLVIDGIEPKLLISSLEQENRTFEKVSAQDC